MIPPSRGGTMKTIQYFSIVTISLIVIFSSVAFGINQQTSKANESSKSNQANHEKLIQTLKQHQGIRGNALTELNPILYTFNEEAPIPPQCYTRIEGKYNPCYVCHQNEVTGRENVLNDGSQQLAYNFSDQGLKNHWKNLFEDKTEKVAQISNKEIEQWINQDNYSNLATRLQQNSFKGWIPDLKNLQLGKQAFDQYGLALDGSHWVAFNYKPLPSTFWPTNGSTDDVMIRLPKEFRTTKKGEFSLDIYRANLAIMEAQIKGLQSISSLPIDEQKIDIDLNQDGKLTPINEIKSIKNYIGAAENRFADNYLYPEGTEFLHTVRYVGTNKVGDIAPSTRMKEVRYMKKWRELSKPVYARQYQLEGYAKDLGHLPKYRPIGDYGLDNGYGWAIQGFIENAQGELRTASYEENLFCMGCHAAIGATIDKTFSFPRKVDGANGWGYIDLKAMTDAPNKGEQQGEYATYLQRVGGGGEFRSNEEMFARWFHQDRTVNLEKLNQADSIYDIITPSAQRATMLNKAYKVIVDDQDYIYGRDATVTPPKNVYDAIDIETAPTLPKELFFPWDIRLNWQKTSHK